ncbi:MULTISPECIES: 5-dehydro-4-deoxy-D-glucuronate isomerase [Dactylosporangium]|uniref:4-deoxy-L-threo-5-hexosulose-uronate ketol-isomerase n=2 Tax=Dactylosporangium TaxID=35753 RepID=A0A9W6KIG7_9ACTN|nr:MULTISPECIES: 5-dehydro-4-deoxy-D-glucuronate isomerase [Dactylosporangium]UAB99372.1 5-dehydro-4-deoxy-D-glucuronate isomerase [Dactylosporangium vinaceum]UWZ47599.1 5-dehydro-4-deoxy-D-glucuronate isomerase [Dactylosporangium matsuzakiense]GLL01567.1 4-deoxy-L-threo-5-hexosulose-uronate ketol-isomerase [Dactylosporangium matsuzakiense]
MRNRHATAPAQVPGFDTAALRANYLVEDLFPADRVELLHTHEDRIVIGGVAPAAGTSVALEVPDGLAADYFLQRREAGIVNIGAGAGRVTVDGTGYELEPREVLYAGRGSRDVVFEGTGEAAYYLISTTAHAEHPTRKATRAEATPVSLGEQRTSNERTIYKYIHEQGIRSCQLVLGVTELAAGSMWNTMPAHVHGRRTEIYLYFGLDPDQRVVHLMGEPQQTRNLIVADRQAVISPGWSVHCGFGTAAYAFVWAMGGENTDYGDVVPYPITELR